MSVQSIEAQGQTRFYTFYPDIDPNPQWRETYKGEVCVARGYFERTHDGAENTQIPLFVEINPSLDSVMFQMLTEAYGKIGVPIVKFMQFETKPFAQERIQTVVKEMERNEIARIEYYDQTMSL